MVANLKPSKLRVIIRRFCKTCSSPHSTKPWMNADLSTMETIKHSVRLSMALKHSIATKINSQYPAKTKLYNAFLKHHFSMADCSNVLTNPIRRLPTPTELFIMMASVVWLTGKMAISSNVRLFQIFYSLIQTKHVRG